MKTKNCALVQLREFLLRSTQWLGTEVLDDLDGVEHMISSFPLSLMGWSASHARDAFDSGHYTTTIMMLTECLAMCMTMAKKDLNAMLDCSSSYRFMYLPILYKSTQSSI